MAKKIFVLDTSVLLHSPQSLYSFGDNDIVIPIVVLDELDKFQRGTMEINRNARLVIKELDTLRSSGRIDKGVSLASGATSRSISTTADALEMLPPASSTTTTTASSPSPWR